MTQDRFRGCLVGLACGDAVGTTVEFCSPGSFDPVEDMTGEGPFHLRAGEWTDDTSMALCLATSLLETPGFDPRDQMQRYVRWMREGYLSSNGRCFDIGMTVRAALGRFEQSGNPFCGSSNPHAAGNGSLMRLAAVPMYYCRHPARAIEAAADSSRTTHGAPTAVDACRYMAVLIVGALAGISKEKLLASYYAPLSGYWAAHPLTEEIDAIAAGSFRSKQPPEIRGDGYVVHSLEAALWAFYHSDNFRDGCLRAVNLGEDADTTAAVYGQLAGAFYGMQAIPLHWRQRLAHHDQIVALADRLYEASAHDIKAAPAL